MRLNSTVLALLALLIAASTSLRAESRSRSRLRPVSATLTAPPMGAPVYGADMGCCDTCCNTVCCCPPVIPAILSGIDCLLTKVLCCQPCADPCCDTCVEPSCAPLPNLLWSKRFQGSGKKGAVPYDSEMSVPLMPPDPFIDDPMEPGVTRHDVRNYQLWNMRQPARQATGRVVGHRRDAPRAISVHAAEPIPARKKIVSRTVSAKPVVRTASSDAVVKVPANPLRD